jgi:PAS domain S-box-containing protein
MQTTSPSSDGSEQFRGIVSNLPAALYTTDADGVITYFNPAAAQLWGRSPVIGEDMWCGSWRLYWPDGTALPHSECPMAVTVKTGKPVRGVEAVCERPDGSRFPFTPFPTPMFDEAGKLTGAVNMLIELPLATRTSTPPTAPPIARATQRDVALAALFDQTARLVHRDDGMTPTQWAIMRYLSRTARAREEAQVVAYVGASPASIVRDLSLLVRHGFICRTPAPPQPDTLFLTEQGRQALDLDPLKRLARAIAQLSEERSAVFAESLESVADRLASDGEPQK